MRLLLEPYNPEIHFFRISYVDFLIRFLFVWDFTATMQTENLTDVSVTKLLLIEPNDKPRNRKKLVFIT